MPKPTRAQSGNTSEQLQVNRSIAWVGAASSFVGILDVLSHFIILFVLGLEKTEYGGAGVALLALYPALDAATDMGIAAAIVQRDDHTEARISTVFWLNIIMSLFMVTLIYFLLAPFVAQITKAPVVEAMLIVYGFKLMWQNVYFIPYALMKRELRFGELSVIRMIANVGEFTAKIGFAAAGFGVWCFVIAPICRVLITGIGVQLRHSWRPKFIFELADAWGWYVFGLKSSGSKILFHLYTNVDYFIVIHVFGKEASTFYYLAYQIVLAPTKVLSEVVTSVAFPVFARIKNDLVKLRAQLISFSRLNLVVLTAFLGAICVSAEEILALATDFPPGGGITLQVLCGVGVLRAISYLLPPLLDGRGYTGRTLLYMCIASIVVPSVIWGCAHWFAEQGPHSVAIGWLIGYPIPFFVLLLMSLAVLEMPLAAYVRGVRGVLICGATAVFAASVVRFALIDAPLILRLVIPIFVLLAIFGTLLGKTQGLSLKAIGASLKQ